MGVWGATSARSLWRPQKLATRDQPLPPETSFTPFVLILNLSLDGRGEPAALGTGKIGGAGWDVSLGWLALECLLLILLGR